MRTVRLLLKFAPAVFCVALLLACGGGSSSSSSGGSTPSQPQVPLTQLSSDQFTNPQSQHATEVEPALFASGSNLVTVFQVGRIYNGGAANIGFATSTNGGTSWSNGLLPGITAFQGGGTYSGVSDPSVVFDQAHGVWLVASLAITATTDQVVVSRSSDAHTWSGPVVVSTTADADKNWITCDNNSASPYFGHCYVEWDNPSNNAGGLIWMSTSTDGGVTWSAATNTADMARGLGGQPIVGAGGLVVVPIESIDGTQMLAFTSSDGGATWARSVVISAITDHTVAGNLRTSALPSAAVDGAGRVYVAWQDCRFRTNCSANDIVMSTSSDGSNWTAPMGIPIDAESSTVDHFIPGLGVDASTSGGSTHLALTYYFYPTAACTAATCQLYIGTVASSDGGNTWSSPTTLSGPMSLSWLPATTSGVMVGDYIATAYSNSHAYGVFAVAQASSGSAFNEAMYTTTSALPQTTQSLHSAVRPELAVTRRSDHGPRKFYDLDHEHPIPKRKK